MESAANKSMVTLSQKVATDAVQRAEKHLGNMCQNIGNINVKHGKIRDLADRLAHGCVAYGNEEYGTSLNELHHFAEHVSAVQDYRQAYIDQIQQKVVPILSGYGMKCKSAKNEIKKLEKQQKDEIKKANKIKKANGNMQQQAQHSHELQILSNSVASQTQLMKERVLDFEAQRLQDVKEVLTEYCRIELTYAAKSLEQWSQCMQKVTQMSPDDDIKEFEKLLNPHMTTHAGIGMQSTANALANMSHQQPTLAKSTYNSTTSVPTSHFSASNLPQRPPNQPSNQSISQPSVASINSHQTTVSQAVPPASQNPSLMSQPPQQTTSQVQAFNEQPYETDDTESEYETMSEEEEEEEPQAPTRTAVTGW